MMMITPHNKLKCFGTYMAEITLCRFYHEKNHYQYHFLSLQAKAQGHPHTVIIVGTHIDKIHRSEREQMKRIWIDKLEQFRIGQRASRGFPSIVAIHFVGCPPKTKNIGVDTLNDIIYTTATNMEARRGTLIKKK